MAEEKKDHRETKPIIPVGQQGIPPIQQQPSVLEVENVMPPLQLPAVTQPPPHAQPMPGFGAGHQQVDTKQMQRVDGAAAAAPQDHPNDRDDRASSGSQPRR